MHLIHFSHPQYLLLLPLLWAFTWWVLRGSLADLDRTRGRLSTFVRLGLCTLIVLALAGTQFVHSTNTLCTAFVVNVSDSITAGQRETALQYIREAIQHKRANDRMVLIAFGAEALLDHAADDLNTHIDHIYSIDFPCRLIRHEFPVYAGTGMEAGISCTSFVHAAHCPCHVILFPKKEMAIGKLLPHVPDKTIANALTKSYTSYGYNR
jgi:hypothetical protein